MYREMRFKSRAIPIEEAREILHKGDHGVLATVDQDNQPYGVPISFVMIGDTIYIHCASEGQKADNMAHQPKVCFTVVGSSKPFFGGGHFSTLFESVVVYGQARKVTDDTEKRQAMESLCRKYLPDYMGEFSQAMDADGDAVAVYAISMDHVTGKAGRPL